MNNPRQPSTWTPSQVEASERREHAREQAAREFDAEFDITLTEEQANCLRVSIGIEAVASPVRLQIGEGHSGRGLYVSLVEYPEEGSALIAAIDKRQQT